MSLISFEKNKTPTQAIWLWGMFILLLAMIMLGGATRLTHAGLSIVEWKPITGIIPPFTLNDWMLEFRSYQKSPEYHLVNQGMSLEDFKFIFWMEFSHRFLGRLIGFYLLVPMVYFWMQGRLSNHLKITSVFMLVLLGLQGFLGWYMVESGLSKDPMVSPYRLSVHLLMAFALIATTLNAISHLKKGSVIFSNRCAIRWSFCNLILVVFTVFYGALVAGHKAGLIYNTFPFMEGQWVPSEWNFQKPLWINFFENHATVQFVHRQLAYIVLISAGLGAWKKWISKYYLAVVLGQLMLGVTTLLYSVPATLGTLHQGWSVIVFSMAFWSFRSQIICKTDMENS